MLIVEEKQKWDADRAKQGTSRFDVFADDFISSGYAPGGGVRVVTKAQMVSGEYRLGPAEFELSDFKVITASGDSAVVTYRARRTDNAPPGSSVSLLATSVWVKRGGEWKTIFYQATKAQ